MAKVYVTTLQRQEVVQRAAECCEYCWSQAQYSPDPFSVEHIVPRSKGGTNDLDNLAYACQGCNNRKYTATNALDLVTGTFIGLYHPRRDSWHEHFAWNDDYTLIVGITPAGRASIEKLQLNRSGVVNLRRILAAAGVHPPR